MTDASHLRQMFEICVDQHADSMYRVAYRLLGDHDLANELVQETYYQAWKSIESLANINRMKSWMFAILRNQYTKFLRVKKRTRQLSDTKADSLPAREKPVSDEQSQLQLAIEQLDENYKLPILLVSMEQLSVNEAATILDVPRGTVLSRLHRGREKLKLILGQISIKDA